MGAMQNNPKKGKGRKKGRRRNSVQADWSEANAEYIYYLTVIATSIGGAVLFGRSRDGGAYSIKFYESDGDWKDYLPGGADVNAWLREIIDDYSEVK